MYTLGRLAMIIKQVDFFTKKMLFFANARKIVPIIVIIFSTSFMQNKPMINIFSKTLLNRHGDLDPF